MLVPHARARFLAAIAFGVSCRPQTDVQQVDVTTPPPASGSASVTASATATATVVTTATATATATASATTAAVVAAPTAPSNGLVCPASSKKERTCLAKNSVPYQGNAIPAQPYSAWDANGCFAAKEMVGTCSGISDARGPFVVRGQCCFDICQGQPAPCGLALVIDGAPRAASLRAGSNADEALMEHASIAAFARLSLELLSLGAPAELVRAAHQAALDEIEHARILFGWAGAEPGPLRLDGLTLRDRRTLARELARDSCVGETVAALELARRATRDPERADALRKMSADELEHAALGWSILAWLGEDVDISVGAYDVDEEVLSEARALVAELGV